MFAAAEVLGTGSAWPYLGVAIIMTLLGIVAAQNVIVQARAELAQAATGV